MKYLTFLLISLLLVVIGFQSIALGQLKATLSVQGVLREPSGKAVADGKYFVTFKIYDVATGGTALWDEAIEVTVKSGVFSTVLGNTKDLNLPFNKPYYVGVTVSGNEMQPRIQLTTAPYALSLIGSDNTFPGSGNVGIGTNSPSPNSKLQVNGSIKARGGPPGTDGVNNNGYGFQGNNGDYDGGMYSSADGQIEFYTNGKERMRITNNEVAVINGGITSVWEGDVGPRLLLRNLSKTTAGTAYQWAIFNMTGLYGNSLQFWAYDYTNPCHGGMCASRMTIMDNGNVGIGTSGPAARLHVVGSGQTSAIISASNGSYRGEWPSGWGGGLATWDITCASIYLNGLSYRSDSRYKENIQSIGTGLNFIKQLRSVSYKFKDDVGEKDQGTTYGFVAQEIEAVMPDLVTTDNNGYKGIKMLEIMPFMVKAIQEQQQQIEALKTENENLKARVNALEKGR